MDAYAAEKVADEDDEHAGRGGIQAPEGVGLSLGVQHDQAVDFSEGGGRGEVVVGVDFAGKVEGVDAAVVGDGRDLGSCCRRGLDGLRGGLDRLSLRGRLGSGVGSVLGSGGWGNLWRCHFDVAKVIRVKTSWWSEGRRRDWFRNQRGLS